MTPDFIAEYCMRGAVCGWPAVAHTLYREGLHAAFAPAIVLAAFAVQVLGARVFGWWPTLYGGWRYAVPLLAASMMIVFREFYDVYAGDSPLKSVFDALAPMVFGGLSAWLIWWLTPYFSDARYEMSVAAADRRARRAYRRVPKMGPKKPEGKP